MAVHRLTTLINPATSYDLVTLDQAKKRLKISTGATADDDDLNEFISDVSTAISRHCNRASATADEASFPVEQISDLFYPDRDAYPYLVPGGMQPMQLSHWPVAQVERRTLASVLPAGSTVVPCDVSKLKDGMPVGGINVAPVGSLPPLGGAQAIQIGTTIALGTGSVTLSLPTLFDIPAGSSMLFGLAAVQTDPPGNDTLLIEGIDFKIDGPRGQLLRLDRFTRYPVIWPALQVLVTYAGGYDPIPPDIVNAALRWVTQLFNDRGREPNLRSFTQPGLGEKTYWVGGPATSGGVPDEILSFIERYRVPVVA